MVPKILHYIWIGAYTDPSNYVDSWLDLHPDFVLMKWDNTTGKKYIDESIQLLGGIDTLKGKSVVYLADMMKYLILRDYGGVYLDHDFKVVKNLEELYEGFDFTCTFQYPSEYADQAVEFKRGATLQEVLDTGIYSTMKFNVESVNACFFATVPVHPLTQRCVDLAIENHNKPVEEQYAMRDWGWGPCVTTDVMKEFGLDTTKGLTVSKNKVKILDCKYVHPVHGRQRSELGKEKYLELIDDLCKNESTYAVHIHEHFGTGMFLNKEMVTIDQWYINTY